MYSPHLVQCHVHVPWQTVECSKKAKDHLQKALAAFNKEIRHNQHKVHLLCLVARGLYLSRQCDDIVRQGLLLSVLGEKDQV